MLLLPWRLDFASLFLGSWSLYARILFTKSLVETVSDCGRNDKKSVAEFWSHWAIHSPPWVRSSEPPPQANHENFLFWCAVKNIAVVNWLWRTSVGILLIICCILQWKSLGIYHFHILFSSVSVARCVSTCFSQHMNLEGCAPAR